MAPDIVTRWASSKLSVWLYKKGAPCGEYARPEACRLLLLVDSMGAIKMRGREGMLPVIDMIMVALSSVTSI